MRLLASDFARSTEEHRDMLLGQVAFLVDAMMKASDAMPSLGVTLESVLMASVSG